MTAPTYNVRVVCMGRSLDDLPEPDAGHFYLVLEVPAKGRVCEVVREATKDWTLAIGEVTQ